MKAAFIELEQKIGYEFVDKKLLTQAMTHSSYANEKHMEKSESNERLEFLGDAVLEAASSDFLYHKYAQRTEGELTKLRASIVCETSLAYCANCIMLGDYLLLGKGEEHTGGRKRNSVISDAMEALIGAIYLDGGFLKSQEFVLNFVLNDLENKQLFFDSKTILQEMIHQENKEVITYELVKEDGPPHDKLFEVYVKWGDQEIGRGQGRTKKAAEQTAAYHAILKIKEIQGDVCI